MKGQRKSSGTVRKSSPRTSSRGAQKRPSFSGGRKSGTSGGSQRSRFSPLDPNRRTTKGRSGRSCLGLGLLVLVALLLVVVLLIVLL